MRIITRQGQEIQANLVELYQDKQGQDRPLVVKYLNLTTGQEEKILVSQIQDLKGV